MAILGTFPEGWRPDWAGVFLADVFIWRMDKWRGMHLYKNVAAPAGEESPRVCGSGRSIRSVVVNLEWFTAAVPPGNPDLQGGRGG